MTDDLKPRLLHCEPQIFVSEIAKSCEFYTAKLGFTLEFVYGEPTFYAQVARDTVRLNLRSLDEPAVDPELRAREDLLSVTVTVNAVQPLFSEYEMAGVEFHQLLQTEPWGASTFIVRDPDRNLLLFCSAAS